MTAKQILDSFSETLMEDERILTARERALVGSILRSAKATSNANPETHAAVNAAVASAVGEAVAQRAFAVVGGSIVERIVAASSTDAEEATAYTMPRPALEPQLKQVPQPPGKSQPAGPQPVPQPPGTSPLGPQPVPQPPGHGFRPQHVQMKAGKQPESASQVEVLDRADVLPANSVVLDEFLAPHQVEELTSYVLQHERDFALSEVISPAGGVVDCEHRRSQVLMDIGYYEDLFMERIKAVLPAVFRRLGMEEHAVTRSEFQATASNDGDFFRLHADDGHEEIASRYLTFVYFFHREPKQFEGGELRIHDSHPAGVGYGSAETYQTIVPQQNQIVFFPCKAMHEITPVKCRSRAFADSRFTVNGWLHR